VEKVELMGEKHEGNSRKSVAERVKQYRWRPGTSGNPKGRPKLPAVLSDALRHRLGETAPGDKHRRTFAQRIAERLCEAALRGSVSAAVAIMDRVEGKPQQSLVGANGKPLFPSNEDITVELRKLIDEIKEKNGNDVG